jgi:hypothetical protein
MSGMASLDGGDAGAAAGEEGVRGAAAITLALGMAGELISPRSECALCCFEMDTLFTGIHHADCDLQSRIYNRTEKQRTSLVSLSSRCVFTPLIG